MRPAAPLAGFVLSLFLGATPLLATAGTWTGAGTTPNWSEAANWLGGQAPVPGEKLFFPAGAAQATMVNDLGGATFEGLYFGGPGFTLVGGPLTLTGSNAVVVHEVGGQFLLNLPVRFANPLPIAGFVDGGANPPLTKLIFCCSGPLTFAGGTFVVSAGQGHVVIGSNLAEESPTGIYHRSGELIITGESGLTGVIGSEGSHLVAGRGGALGSSSAPVFAGGVLAFVNQSPASTMYVTKSFVVSGVNPDPAFGSVVALGGGRTDIAGAVHIAGPGVVFQPISDLGLRGVVSSAGFPLVVDLADGQVWLWSSLNTFDDSVEVRRGRLVSVFASVIPDANAVSVGANGAWEQRGTEVVREFTCRGRWVTLPVNQALVVTGAVDVQGCQLETMNIVSPTPGTQIVLIDRATPGPMGTFAGLPEGALVMVGMQPAHVTYHGGADGNDFALDVLPVLPAVQLQALFSPAPTQLRNTLLGAFLVLARDEYDRLAPGRVRYEAFDGCGTFAGSPVAVVDTTSGFAPSPQFTTGNVSRTCTVTASLDGASASVSWTFHLYDPQDVTMTPVPAEVFSVAGSPYSVAVDVLGAGGMQLPGLLVVFEAQPAGGAGVQEALPQLGTASPVRATAQFTANGVAGDYAIVARVGPVSRAIPVHQSLP